METKVKKAVKKAIAKMEEPIRTHSLGMVSVHVDPVPSQSSKTRAKQISTITEYPEVEIQIPNQDGNKTMTGKKWLKKKKGEKVIEATHIGDVMVRANAIAAADIMNYLNPSLHRQGMTAPELSESQKKQLWTRPGNVNDIRYQTLQELMTGESNSRKVKTTRPATARPKTLKRRVRKNSASSSTTPLKHDNQNSLKHALSVTKIALTSPKKKSIHTEEANVGSMQRKAMPSDGHREHVDEAETVFSCGVFETSSSHEDIVIESPREKKKADENRKFLGSKEGGEVAFNSKGSDNIAKNGKKISKKGKKNQNKKVKSNLSESLKEFFEIQNQQVDDLHAHVYGLQENLEKEVHDLINEIEIEEGTSPSSSSSDSAVTKFKNLLQKQKQIIRLQIDLRKRYGVFSTGDSSVCVEGCSPNLPILEGYNVHFDMFAPYACERNGKMVFYCSSCDVSSESELLFRLHLESPQHVVKAYEEIQESLPEFKCKEGCPVGTKVLKGSTKYFKHVTSDIHAKKPPADAVDILSPLENNLLKTFI